MRLSSLFFLDSQNSERFFREREKRKEPSATDKASGCEASYFLGERSVRFISTPFVRTHLFMCLHMRSGAGALPQGFIDRFQEGMRTP